MFGRSTTTLAGLSTLKLSGSCGKASEKINLICTLSPGNEDVLILSSVAALAEKTPKPLLKSSANKRNLCNFILILFMYIPDISNISNLLIIIMAFIQF